MLRLLLLFLCSVLLIIPVYSRPNPAVSFIKSPAILLLSSSTETNRFRIVNLILQELSKERKPNAAVNGLVLQLRPKIRDEIKKLNGTAKPTNPSITVGNVQWFLNDFSIMADSFRHQVIDGTTIFYVKVVDFIHGKDYKNSSYYLAKITKIDRKNATLEGFKRTSRTEPIEAF